MLPFAWMPECLVCNQQFMKIYFLHYLLEKVSWAKSCEASNDLQEEDDTLKGI